MPHAYLTMVKDERRLVLLHRATHHATALGARAEPWNDKVLMFTGDVVQTQAPQAVFLPSLLLATIQQDVVVHPLNQQLLNFHADDNLEIQEPVDDDVPETMSECIETRHAMYLPAHLVPLFMGTRRTPREALMKVHSALSELGDDLKTFKPLLDWLRVAVTRNGALAIKRASGPSSPIMENRLHERLIQLVKQYLPGWEQIAVSTPQEGARSTNTNLEELMAQFLLQQQPRGAPALTSDAEKNPSQVWKGTINVLLRLTQRAAEDDLPQLWHAWANCRKEERRAVLQERFRRMSRDLRLPEPVATVELTTMLYTLSFRAPYKDKLEHGVQPFAVTYLSQKSVAEQRKLIDMHEILREGSPSVMDIVDLKAVSRISMPTKESQMLRTMRAFGVVLAVALGTSLEHYKAYKGDVIDSYDVIQPKFEALAEFYPQEPIYAQVLRWLQLRLQEYWTEVEVALGRVNPPKFKMLFEAI
jgi:hypothetical protein